MELVRNAGVQMTEMTEQEGTTVPERRESERWTSPRIILTLVQVFLGFLGLCVSVAGLLLIIGTGLIGAYVLSQTKDATSDMSNAALSQGFEKLGEKVDRLTDEIRAGAAKNAELDGKVMMNARDIERETATRAGETGLMNARIIAVEKDLERIKATK